MLFPVMNALSDFGHYTVSKMPKCALSTSFPIPTNRQKEMIHGCVCSRTRQGLTLGVERNVKLAFEKHAEVCRSTSRRSGDAEALQKVVGGRLSKVNTFWVPPTVAKALS